MNNNRTNRKASVKIWSAGLLSACLLTSLAPATYAQAESSIVPLADVSAEAAASVTVQSKTVEEKTDLYDIKMSIPVFSGLADEDYQEELNGAIEDLAMKDLELLKSGAAQDAETAEESGYTFRPHELISSYSLKSDGSEAAGGILSLVVTSGFYTGGAHGETRVDTYNVRNGQTASELTLEDLFGSDYAAIIKQAVNAKISEDPSSYFEDAFQGIDHDHIFYVQGGQAFIVFQQYEIAPYAAGIIEIPVDLPDGDEPAESGASVTVAPEESAAAGEPGYWTQEDGTNLVPLRAVSEKLGFKVIWNKDNGTAEVSKGAKWTQVTPGVDSYTYNRMAPFPLGAAPQLIDNTVYVPASFFSEILDLGVQLDQNTGLLTVSVQS